MKVAVIGTGAVGQVMSNKLSELGHQIFMGTREPKKSLTRKEPDAWGTKGVGAWMEDHPQVQLLPYKEAAQQGTDLLVFAMNGMAALEVLQNIGEELLGDRTMIDISNPLDFSKGFPPTLSVCNTQSLGEQIQQAFPRLKVVKALNTLSHPLMGNPGAIEGDHNLFICGNDAAAKEQVTKLLEDFGWKRKNIVDLGDISNARGTEMLLPLWVRLMGKFQSPMFNFNLVKGRNIPA